jgi:hypothetical protein
LRGAVEDPEAFSRTGGWEKASTCVEGCRRWKTGTAAPVVVSASGDGEELEGVKEREVKYGGGRAVSESCRTSCVGVSVAGCFRSLEPVALDSGGRGGVAEIAGVSVVAIGNFGVE